MKIVNIIATVNLKKPLDLIQLHRQIENSEFSLNNRWLKMRLPPNNNYIAFYKSGKFLVIGKSLTILRKIIESTLNILKNAGVNIEKYDVVIHNIVISDILEIKNSIETMMNSLDPKKASYENEQFPALLYKDWGVSFLLFNNGKLILCGVKNEKQGKLVLKKFRDLILKL